MARVKGTREYLSSWMYDTVRFTAGVLVTQATFFQIPLGQPLVAGVNKTYTHTNILTAGMLSGIKTFEVSAWVFQPSAFLQSNDVQNLLAGNGGLIINDKPYPDRFPLSFFMGGAGWTESVRSPGPIGVADFRANPGDQRMDNVIKFAKAFRVEIDTFENYRMQLDFDPPGYTPTETFDLKCIFFGRKGREVM